MCLIADPNAAKSGVTGASMSIVGVTFAAIAIAVMAAWS